MKLLDRRTTADAVRLALARHNRSAQRCAVRCPEKGVLGQQALLAEEKAT